MNKKIKTIATLKIPSGEASSKPPLGSIIGQFGVPIMDFCNLFNKITTETNYKKGMLINCNLIIYTDFSFSVEIKNIDLSYLIKISFKDKLLNNKKELTSKRGRVQSLLYGIKKRKNRKKKKKLNLLYLSTISLYEIAKIKYGMLNKSNISFISFYKSVFGSCKSMGYIIFTSNQSSTFFYLKKTFFLFLIKQDSEKKKKKYFFSKPINHFNNETLLLK